MRMMKNWYLLVMIGFLLACGDESSGPSQLEAPDDLEASDDAIGEIELEWDEVDGAEEYNIYRADYDDFMEYLDEENIDDLDEFNDELEDGELDEDDLEDAGFDKIDDTDDNDYTDDDVDSGVTYFYYITADNGEEGLPSEVVEGMAVTDEVDPTDADALAGVLVIPGSNSQSGSAPGPSTDADAPDVNGNQTSASVVSGNTLYLPFNFVTSSTSGTGYGGCYVSVDGATSYWDIPSTTFNTDLDGQIVIPVNIPDVVGNGSFCLSYCIYDNNNRVSNVLSTCVTVEPIQTCPAYESGSDGLTIFSVDLGEDAGTSIINYDTYSVPDRVDVFYNDSWIGGTGSALSTGQFPPVSQCYDGADGYVGASGTINVNYDPNLSRVVTIYMSGCIGSGTAWDVSVGCPN